MSKQPIAPEENVSFWHKPVVVVLGAAWLFFMVQLIGAFIITPLASSIQSNNIRMLLFTASGAIVLLGLIALAIQRTGLTWASLGFRMPKHSYLLVTLPAFVGYIMVSMSLTFLAQQIVPGFDTQQAQEIGFTVSTTPVELLAAFASLVVLTPLIEETVFRGVLFKGLRKRVPFWLGAVITSALFAIAHGQWNVAVDTFALSLLLCFLVEKSGSIWPAILLHALKNGLAFILLFIVKAG